jgi:hypothetical protein
MALAGVYLLGLSLAGYVDRQAPSAGLRVTEPVYLAQPGLMGMPASAPHHRLSDFVRVEADSSMNPVVNASAPEGLFAIGANLRRSGLERASHSLAR